MAKISNTRTHTTCNDVDKHLLIIIVLEFSGLIIFTQNGTCPSISRSKGRQPERILAVAVLLQFKEVLTAVMALGQ